MQVLEDSHAPKLTRFVQIKNHLNEDGKWLPLASSIVGALLFLFFNPIISFLKPGHVLLLLNNI